MHSVRLSTQVILFVMVKACVKPVPLFRQANNGGMRHKYATDSTNTVQVLNS